MKKCLCLLLSLTMLCLCAGAALAETVALKVWGSQEDQELLAELCEAFAAEHPETTYEFTYGVVGEADAKARYLEDPAAAADVFSYPDDQIIDLVNADALYEVTRNHDAIVAANSVGSVNAASVGGVLYVSRVGFVTPIAGSGYEMKVIAACVLGGISLSGGIGSVIGAGVGAAIMADGVQAWLR